MFVGAGREKLDEEARPIRDGKARPGREGRGSQAAASARVAAASCPPARERKKEGKRSQGRVAADISRIMARNGQIIERLSRVRRPYRREHGLDAVRALRTS